jgi:GTP:adenosylcobinamide-phosphate guanylyltransferase
VKGIGDESPGKASGWGFEQDTALAAEEIIPILIVGKDTSALNATTNDVVTSTWGVYAGLAWHATNVAKWLPPG